MALLTIQDETVAGGILNRLELEIAQEMLTVRDVIAQRVQQEVAAYNSRQQEIFQGLVQPLESEQVLNGFRLLRTAKPIDTETQLYKALEGFLQNSYFVLVNDRQVDSLDEEVWLGSGATASFIKLTPLVGG
ncbi:hypothetical protein [Hymenobacter chitinivorans]|uniref:Uncharacterized protein n=1 Tax=Hymenobacter chitinivorans DSM 11115 TaxID=1121954 RepID=A0A2M9BMM1_9BACT|nr:hypothetical protein [Hymenobacter chitinivorans]PJJ59207.1 hypothetical protein CLV45_0623 [Hymenobacter chitinivorans DSM 11115]